MRYQIELTVQTTDGVRSRKYLPVDTWDEAAASMDGMVAAIGEDNVIRLNVERVA